MIKIEKNLCLRNNLNDMLNEPEPSSCHCNDGLCCSINLIPLHIKYQIKPKQKLLNLSEEYESFTKCYSTQAD